MGYGRGGVDGDTIGSRKKIAPAQYPVRKQDSSRGDLDLGGDMPGIDAYVGAEDGSYQSRQTKKFVKQVSPDLL